MGTFLNEYDRGKLTRIAWHWLETIPEQEVNRVVGEIGDVFISWRDAQAAPDGTIEVPALWIGPGLLGKTKTTRRQAADVEPYAAAGPDVSNDIDLAFKLWLTDYAPFRALLAKNGTEVVFSIITAYSTKTASVLSLVRANSLLGDLLMSEVRTARKAQATNAAKARAASARERSARKQERDRDVLEHAKRYWAERPRARVKEIAYLIHKNNYPNLAVETIKDLLKQRAA